MRRLLYQFAERWLWLAYTVVGAVVLAGALWLAETVEQFVMPVVSKFDVLSVIEQSDGAIYIAGTLLKERNCTITGLLAVNEHGKGVQIHPIPGAHQPGSVRIPPGPAQWGPWKIDPQGSRFVTIYSKHTCHPLWTTTTLLASFQVTPRYE